MLRVNLRAFGKISTVAIIGASFILAACSEMYSRSDFEARVKDKSDTEVTKLIGKPAAVDSSAPDRVTWTYNSRTFNIDAGNKFDTKAVVVFSKAANGGLRATDVVFE